MHANLDGKHLLARIWHGARTRGLLLEKIMLNARDGRTEKDAEIARWEVSDDGVHWRPYNPARDTGPLLHKRIEFAPPRKERRIGRRG